MERAQVDIVLATNRVGEYLETTLDSVRRQSSRHWRLIVVDDGSPDAEAVARAISRIPRSTLVRQTNRGPSAARNRGIAAGSSPLIALLDDDDVWEPEKLEEQVAALAAEPAAVAAFTAGSYIDGDGRVFGDGWVARTEPPHRFVSGEAPLPRIVTLMVRRSAHESIGGFNETYRLAEDNEYILRLAICGQMVAVPRPLVAYRRHLGNTSDVNSLEARLASRRVVEERLVAHRHDAVIRNLLMENLARLEDRGVDECVRALGAAALRRDVSRIAREVQWAAGSPHRFRGVLARVASRF